MNTMNIPLVSIGIPAYKSRYLSRAIDSVLGQTYQNLEVIIVNDCSPQNVNDVVAQYNDERIRYFVNEHNVGAEDPGNNWNICLKYAQGTFFCLLCDDDIYEPTFVEEMIALSEKYPTCNVFHSNVKVVNLQNKIMQQFPKFPQWESCADYIKNRSRGLRKQTISEWMFRRTHIVNIGGYTNLPLAWGADYLSIMRFAVKGGIASTDKMLVTFRRSDENITMTFVGNSEKKMQALFIYQIELKKLIKENKELSSKGLLVCADKIRKKENMPILIGSSKAEYKQILVDRDKYGLKASEIIYSFIRRAIKMLLHI